MTMTLHFADGFTSNSSPQIDGVGNESFPLLNNQIVPVKIDNLSFMDCSSVDAYLEIERQNGSIVYRQCMNIMFSFDSNTAVWSYDMGGFRADDLLKDAIVDEQDVTLEIDINGDLWYTSGNMDDTGYVGKFKFNLNRITI